MPQVLDYAVLVVSQDGRRASHAETLWRLLRSATMCRPLYHEQNGPARHDREQLLTS